MLKIQLAITSYLKGKIVSHMARKMLKWAFPDAGNICALNAFVCIENSLQNSLCIEQFESSEPYKQHDSWGIVLEFIQKKIYRILCK